MGKNEGKMVDTSAKRAYRAISTHKENWGVEDQVRSASLVDFVVTVITGPGSQLHVAFVSCCS